MCHCTPAWVTRAKLGLKKKKERKKKSTVLIVFMDCLRDMEKAKRDVVRS